MDYELVEKILQGDFLAFEKLVDKYQGLVYNLSYKFFGNFQDAEDISQEVFLKVYKNIKKCRNKETIKTWIYTLTYNTCVDELRRRKIRKIIYLDKNNEYDNQENTFKLEVKDKDKTPEEKLLIKENIKELEKALNNLNEISRTLIYLKDIKQFSYEEISQITSLKLGTIKSKLNRARSKLKENMKYFF